MAVMKDLDLQARDAAESVARQLTEAARGSGDKSVLFVTGNALFPPLRWFPELEALWQIDNRGLDLFGFAVELLEDKLNTENVYLGTAEEGSVYVVDTARWEYTNDGEYAETYSEEWTAK